MTSPKKHHNHIADKVLTTIHREQVVPEGRWRALLQKGLPWLGAGLVVLVGGLAISITLFVALNHDWGRARMMYVALELGQYLPLLWLGLGASATALWLWFTKNTEFGYRRTVIVWFAYGLLAMVIVGSLGYRLGVGLMVDRHLAERWERYESVGRRMMTPSWQSNGESRPAVAGWLRERDGARISIEVVDGSIVELSVLQPELADQLGPLGTHLRTQTYVNNNTRYACRVLVVNPTGLARVVQIVPDESGLTFEDHIMECKKLELRRNEIKRDRMRNR
jgi:hypothetical protein